MKNLVNKNITSYKNPEYKFLISLKKNRNRKSEMKSIAEGYRENLQLIEKFIAKNIRIVEVSEKIFKEISYRDRPDGILTLFNTKYHQISNNLSGPILIPDQIEKPGNLGTMIRTSKSFGINNIILSDEVTDIFNPNVIRSSIGHIFNTNIWSSTNQELISILNKKGYQILLLDPDGEVDIEEFKPNINFALVVGAEQYGISDNWFESRHTSIRIRSTNNVDSLNASTAAAIGMWELTK